MTEQIRKQTEEAVLALCEAAKLKEGDLVVIGCSSSEICGEKIGSGSNTDVAEAVFLGAQAVLAARGIGLAAQCCEHLNRAVIVERRFARGGEIVNVLPQPKAGGSFATAAYAHFDDPVALEEIRADAGLDIGGTLIGMHLRRVAVPVRLPVTKIGEANLIAARTRPKFIGGVRAHYDEDLL